MGGVDLSAVWRPFAAFFNYPPKSEIEAIKEADHTYIRGHEGQRSPCPFLNSLSNHNYLPRDGKNITQSKLKAALIVSSNASPTLAEVQSGIVKSVAHLDGTFTLVDLRKHNAIEHDRSFTRLDFRQGDNTSFQPAMFRAFLADAEGGPITPASIARTRARRDAEGKQDVEAQPLGVRLWLTTWTQTCVLLEFFGQEVSVEDITMLYQEERLPEWWIENPGHPTLHSLLGTVLNVFWKHLWVKVPRGTLDNPQREW